MTSDPAVAGQAYQQKPVEEKRRLTTNSSFMKTALKIRGRGRERGRGGMGAMMPAASRCSAFLQQTANCRRAWSGRGF